MINDADPGRARSGAQRRREACAGNGKTWLLASRIVRLLLIGAAPEEGSGEMEEERRGNRVRELP